MRMRTATGLNGTYLFGGAEITDVEDTNTPKTLLRNILGNTLETTIESAAGLLYRHDE